MNITEAKTRMLRPAALRNVRYLGSAWLKVRNWPRFVVDYVSANDAGRVYTLRNGIELETRETVDTATIGVVFLRREYGAIGSNWTVIDVGANIGVFTLYAAATGGRVYAYEPMPELRAPPAEPEAQQQARPGATVSLWRCEPPRCRDLFVAKHNVGHSLVASNTGSDRKVSIECVSLADIFADNAITHCDLLKLDCEGAELEILEAAPAGILRQIRRIWLEWHRGYDLDDLIRRLVDGGFRVVSRTAGDDGRGMVWADRQEITSPD